VPDISHLGRYKAFLSVEYGSEQLASVHDTDFFYLVPFQQLLLIFGGVLMVAVGATVFSQRT